MESAARLTISGDAVAGTCGRSGRESVGADDANAIGKGATISREHPIALAHPSRRGITGVVDILYRIIFTSVAGFRMKNSCKIS